MKLVTSIKVYFDDIQGMINEVKRLQTYKLFEGDDMVLVGLDAIVAVMANHVKADKCSESPNGWIPCSERPPEPRIDVWCNSDMGQMVGYYDETTEAWYGRDLLELLVNAWMPLPEPYQPKEDEE